MWDSRRHLSDRFFTAEEDRASDPITATACILGAPEGTAVARDVDRR